MSLKTLLTAVSVTVLASCAAMGGGSAGPVHQIGKDSFNVRVLSEKSTSTAKQQALGSANTFCQKDKRNVMVVEENAGLEEGTGEKYYDLTFMCLGQGDQDFVRINKRAKEAPVTPAAE